MNPKSDDSSSAATGVPAPSSAWTLKMWLFFGGLFSPFCPQLFETDGTQGLLPEQLPGLAARLDAMRV